MKKLAAALLGAFLAAAMAPAAFAQGKTDPDAQWKATPSGKATATEKADARKARVVEGKKIAKTGSVDSGPVSAGAAKAAGPAEKKEAAAKRKADAAAAVKKGETSSGEK